MALTLTMAQAEKFDPDIWQSMKDDTSKLSDNYVATVAMCKLCIRKATQYKEDMRDDKLAEATLNNYLRKIKIYCGPIISAEGKE